MTHTKLFIVDFKQITLRNVNVHHAAITSSAALDGRKNEGNKGGGDELSRDRQREREAMMGLCIRVIYKFPFLKTTGRECIYEIARCMCCAAFHSG